MRGVKSVVVSEPLRTDGVASPLFLIKAGCHRNLSAGGRSRIQFDCPALPLSLRGRRTTLPNYVPPRRVGIYPDRSRVGRSLSPSIIGLSQPALRGAASDANIVRNAKKGDRLRLASTWLLLSTLL
jgi:hypothetical protein